MPERSNRPTRHQAPPAPPDPRLARLGLIGGILASAIGLAFYAVTYLQIEAWQILVVAVFHGIGLASAGTALALLHRERYAATAYLIALGLALNFVGTALSLAGATPYLLASGVVLVILAGSLIQPRKIGEWLVIAALLGGSIWLIDYVEPLPRYNVIDSPALRTFTPAVSAVVALFVLALIVRVLRVGTIRARLLISFVLMTLLLVTVIGGAATGIILSYGQRQAIERLESIVTLKESEVNAWLETLQTDIQAELRQELSRARLRTLLREPPDSQEYYYAYGAQYRAFQQSILLRRSFDEFLVIDRDGALVLSSDPLRVETDLAQQNYFRYGIQAPYTTPPFYAPDLDRVAMIVAHPILDEQGRPLGVLAGRANLLQLDRILTERVGLGETGETYMVGTDYIMLTRSYFAFEDVLVRTDATTTAITTRQDGAGVYEGYRGRNVIGVYHWLPDLGMVLIAEQEVTEALAIVWQAIAVNIGVAIAAVTLAAGASLLIARSIGSPLASLAETASQIASGDFSQTIRFEREDEIGTLALAFSSMTVQVNELIDTLERRVNERTRDLEQRSAYLEASAEVARAAASILDVQQLIRQVVELIRERFSLYYTGLFLIDESGKWAVLQAGTGDAGRSMIARGHRLPIGDESMIGWTIAQEEARVALDVGADAVRVATPELPETRSEAALPLRSRGRVLGALTVQSVIPAAFDQDTLTALQTMADQVAVAIDNARLFASAQQAVETAQRAYGTLRQEAWMELLRLQPEIGYRVDERGDILSPSSWGAATKDALRTGRTTIVEAGSARPLRHIAVPIRLSEQTIAVLETHKREQDGEWRPEEIELLETMAEQVAIALESARLYRDTQERAAREQALSQITAHMTRSLNLEAVLQTAISELGLLPGVAEVAVHLRSGDDEPVADARREALE